MIERATVPHRSLKPAQSHSISLQTTEPAPNVPEGILPFHGAPMAVQIVFKIPVRRLTRKVLHSASAKVALALLSEGNPIIEDPRIMS